MCGWSLVKYVAFSHLFLPILGQGEADTIACCSRHFILIIIIMYTQECRFRYQAVIAAISCNPFIAGVSWSTTCSILTTPSYLPQIKILWFVKKNHQILPLKDAIPSAIITEGTFVHNYKTSILHLYDLNIHSQTGEIFCQMELEGESISFLPSNSLIINESYSTLPNACDSNFDQIIDKCSGKKCKKQIGLQDSSERRYKIARLWFSNL